MTKYQKGWVTGASIFLIVFFGLLFWAAVTTDENSIIYETIQRLDTTNVTSISIVPFNTDWPINLTADSVIITNKKSIDDLLNSLKHLTEKHFPKGTKIFWETYLVLHFDKSFKNKLKDKAKLTFHIYDSKEGLFAEMQNVMGYTTYTNGSLKEKLEKITNYHYPGGG
jgi:hypothetical protein